MMTEQAAEVSDSRTFDFDDMVGAWVLESAVAADADGNLSHPFGENPDGVLLYTPDRWVSATITAAGSESAPGVCYAGPVVVSDSEIEHHVEVGVAPFGRGTIQIRGVRMADGRLELAARSADPEPVTTTLTWRRPV